MSSESVSEHFTKGEAKALVGKTFEKLVPLPDLPQGARGLVVATDYQSQSWLVVIKWELIQHRGGQGLHRWFTKDEMRRFLREVKA